MGVITQNLRPKKWEWVITLVDGVGVEKPCINRGRSDLPRDIAFFVLLDRVPLFLLVLAQIIVSEALPHEFHGHRDRPGRDQISVLHRLIEAVGVGRHATLELEEPIGIPVDLVLRRCGQRRKSIATDLLVFLLSSKETTVFSSVIAEATGINLKEALSTEERRKFLDDMRATRLEIHPWTRKGSTTQVRAETLMRAHAI